jgi:hypothetical protein
MTTRRTAAWFCVGVIAGCGAEVTAPVAPTDVTDVPAVRDATEVTDATDVTAMRDATDVIAMRDATDVIAMRDATDVIAMRDATVTVRFSAPTEGETVSDTVILRANASATEGVARVEFFSAGGAYRIGEDRTAPYALAWATAGFVPDGAQRLRVVASDAAGRQATHEVTVRVRNAPASALPAEEVARVTAWFEARRGARYMERDCQPTTYPGWDAVPLRLCRYRVSDSYSGGSRWADVILANAEPAQLARWVVQAAQERRGRVQRSDIDAICANILGQSGGQFPVAGVVYEDMDGTGQRIYPFRHGVTVRIEGLAFATREQPSASQMAAYRSGAVAYVGRYARIAGTLPEHWTALTGERVAADRSDWPGIAARAYREAWGNDRNALLVAWARANL